MADIVVKDGIIVTMDAAGTVLEGSIAIEDGRIVGVGKTDEILKQHRAEEVIDAQGRIVTPGFVCAHTHLYGVALRGAQLGIEPPSDFIQILQRVWWRLDEVLGKKDAYYTALAATLDMVKTGTTCFADTYSGPNSINGVLDEIRKAVEVVGARAFISFESTERHSREEGERGINENERFLRECTSRLVKGMVCVHASFTVSDDHILKAYEVAEKYGAPFTIHVAEGLIDVYHNLERYGARPIERLSKLGVLSERTVLAHCVNLTEEELRIVAESGARVAHNPMSNMLNAVGIAPVPEMLEMGIPVGLGNDGYIFDVFENMRAAFLVHKVNKRDPRVVPPVQVLRMATIDAARLYGVDAEIGSIEVGKRADLVVIKPRVTPTPVSANTAIGYLVYAVSGGDVETVLVDGKPIVKNGVVQTLDEKAVMEEARAAMADLWARLESVGEQIDIPRLK